VDLQGKRVVVTGASRGIGADLARRFASSGARVALVARSAEAIEKLAADLGGHAYPADLADRAARDALIPRIEADGPIDVLVNNAGLLDTVRFTAMDPASIDAIIDVNVHAPIQLARAALPAMVARGSGKIVDISSMAGVVCNPGTAVYSASKAALTHFNECLHEEIRGTGVTTLVVELGLVETEMEANLHTYGPTDRALARLTRLKLTRFLSSERVARSIVRAVARDATTLRMPKRAAAFPFVTALPRNIGRALLKGVDLTSP
jgi:short-subunit dehydrogenase